MPTLDLENTTSGASQLIGDDQLTIRTLKTDDRVQGLRTERGDVRVEVTPGLFGWQAPSDVPTFERYRARLKAGGTAVFSGVLLSEDVSFFDKRETFLLRLTTDAFQQVQESGLFVREQILKETDTSTSPTTYPITTETTVALTRPREDEQDVTESITTVRGYEPWELMDYLLSRLVTEGVLSSYSIPSEAWDDGAATSVSTYRMLCTPPSNDVAETVFALADLFGWRTTVRHSGYPSDDIEITMRRLNADTGSNVLPQKLASGGEVNHETLNPTGIQYAKATAPTQPPRDQPLQKNDKRTYFLEARPPVYRAAGLSDWEAKPPLPESGELTSPTLILQEADPREFEAEMNTLEMNHAPIVVVNTVEKNGDVIPYGLIDLGTAGGGSVTASFTNRSFSSAGLVWSYTPGEPGPFFSASSPETHAVFTRRNNNGFVRNSSWINGPFLNRQELRGFHELVDTEVDGRVTLSDVDLEYTPDRVQFDIDTRTTRLEGRKIRTSRQFPDAPKNNTSRWNPIQRNGRIVPADGGHNNYKWFQLWWERSPTLYAKEAFYEVQMKATSGSGYSIVNGGSTGTWYYVVPPRYPLQQDPRDEFNTSHPDYRHFIWATAVDLQNPFDQAPSQLGEVKVRFRCADGLGNRGSWVEDDFYRLVQKQE